MYPSLYFSFLWLYPCDVLSFIGGPPRPGMMPAPPMAGPPMMQMMGPPPPGMIPLGHGKLFIL